MPSKASYEGKSVLSGSNGIPYTSLSCAQSISLSVEVLFSVSERSVVTSGFEEALQEAKQTVRHSKHKHKKHFEPFQILILVILSSIHNSDGVVTYKNGIYTPPAERGRSPDAFVDVGSPSRARRTLLRIIIPLGFFSVNPPCEKRGTESKTRVFSRAKNGCFLQKPRRADPAGGKPTVSVVGSAFYAEL